MKRRNPDSTKFRKLKKNRIGDGVCSGSLIYLKLFMAWALLMMADFLLGFRFEYLWPFWLLIRSIYDSFRYQGVAFSVFFVCITVTSDLVCFLFIPVQWLFFLASTYVWVQYVWHADRGICLPTVSLWLLFIYVEASVRLKELSASKAFPFTLDLCRPFAAHCIGYPVVTLGFGVKSYVGYKFRLRKQREVARENKLYAQLLAEALPSEWSGNVKSDPFLRYNLSPSVSVGEEGISNGAYVPSPLAASPSPNTQLTGTSGTSVRSVTNNNSPSFLSPKFPNPRHPFPHLHERSGLIPSPNSWLIDSNGLAGDFLSGTHSPLPVSVSWLSKLKEKVFGGGGSGGGEEEGGSDDEEEGEEEEDRESSRGSVDGVGGGGGGGGRGRGTKHMSLNAGSGGGSRSGKQPRRRRPPSVSGGKDSTERHSALQYPCTNYTKDCVNGIGDPHHQNAILTHQQKEKEKVQDKDFTLSLEYDLEKVRGDLKASRLVEQDLKNQIQSLNSSDKSLKNELQQVRQKNEQLENKLHNLVRAREQDKQTIQTLEKKLVEEQRVRNGAEQQLEKERKQKKTEEAAVARALAASSKSDCTESCRSRRRDLEMEVRQAKRDLRSREEQVGQLDMELQQLRQYKDTQNNTEVLMSALETMQEKNNHLHNSLSAENRLKQDLFSALGEANRKLEIAQVELMKKSVELEEHRKREREIEAGSGNASTTVTPPLLSSSSPLTLPNHNNPISAVDAQSLDLLAMYTAAAPYMSNGMGGGVLGGAVENGSLGLSHPMGNSGDSSALLSQGRLSFTPPRTSS